MTGGNVQVLFGVSGIRQAYEMTLKEKRLDIVCLASGYASVIGNYFDADYGPRLFQSDILTREILPDRPENRKDAVGKNKNKNQVKFMKLNENSESDLILMEKKAVLVSYNQNMPYALMIEDYDLVVNLKTQFENLWKRL